MEDMQFVNYKVVKNKAATARPTADIPDFDWSRLDLPSETYFPPATLERIQWLSMSLLAKTRSLIGRDRHECLFVLAMLSRYPELPEHTQNVVYQRTILLYAATRFGWSVAMSASRFATQLDTIRVWLTPRGKVVKNKAATARPTADIPDFDWSRLDLPSETYFPPAPLEGIQLLSSLLLAKTRSLIGRHRHECLFVLAMLSRYPELPEHTQNVVYQRTVLLYCATRWGWSAAMSAGRDAAKLDPSAWLTPPHETETICCDKKFSRDKCSFGDCNRTKAQYSGLRFYQFPIQQPSLCKTWVEVCGNAELTRMSLKTLGRRVLCEEHFEACRQTNLMKSRLLDSSVRKPEFSEATALPDLIQNSDDIDLPALPLADAYSNTTFTETVTGSGLEYS